MTRTALIVISALACSIVAGCKPSDILSVPAPVGVLPGSALNNQSGAESLEGTGVATFAKAFSADGVGALVWSGMLADEFYWSEVTYGGNQIGPDVRITHAVRGLAEATDPTIQNLMGARLVLLEAKTLLQQYEPPSGRSKIGLALALTGYTELLAAEDFCAGLPLATPTANGVAYGTPLTTDALLAAAEADFDSAAAYGTGDAVVAPLAAVGLGRARLNRGNFAGAKTAVANVPTAFVYTSQLLPGESDSPNLNIANAYDSPIDNWGCTNFNTLDRKGTNGMNYLSANDPRLVFNPAPVPTCDFQYGGQGDSTWHYPVKFGAHSDAVPLATGVEARLIEAEAALHGGDVGTWTSDLNALRATVPMGALTADSTTTASADLQVSVMFRERAFWLFGTGIRLGDMRRLVRQYSRDQSTVFSVGPYPFASFSGLPSPITTYGTDVTLVLPTPAGGLSDPNIHYKGCTSQGA